MSNVTKQSMPLILATSVHLLQKQSYLKTRNEIIFQPDQYHRCLLQRDRKKKRKFQEESAQENVTVSTDTNKELSSDANAAATPSFLLQPMSIVLPPLRRKVLHPQVSQDITPTTGHTPGPGLGLADGVESLTSTTQPVISTNSNQQLQKPVKRIQLLEPSLDNQFKIDFVSTISIFTQYSSK